MDSQVIPCPWDEIEDFQTRGEFDRFVAWLGDQVSDGKTIEVPVAAPYLGATSFTEKWFEHLGSGMVWRLVWPDGPFTGLFERVT
jgi:hypothetical protein